MKKVLMVIVILYSFFPKDAVEMLLTEMTCHYLAKQEMVIIMSYISLSTAMVKHVLLHSNMQVQDKEKMKQSFVCK